MCWIFHGAAMVSGLVCKISKGKAFSLATWVNNKWIASDTVQQIVARTSVA